MSTAISLALAFALAGTAAWLVRQLELRREPEPTECSRALQTVFSNSADKADSLLLRQLLEYRDGCMDSPEFVDQARRLMTNTQRVSDARSLLEEVRTRNALKPEELQAQLALVDIAEAQQETNDGNAARAEELHSRAVQSANTLRAAWPEWSLPYRILEEAGRSGPSPTNHGEGIDYYHMEREARAHKLNGAWIRSLSDWQPVAFTFVVSVIGLLAFAAGMDGYLDAREISGLPTSQILNAKPGYVELKGTLHIMPGTQGVIGPHTKTVGVWYELESNSGMKGSSTSREHSAQPFVLRDATGDVIINPKLMEVRTRHQASRFGNSTGQLNGARLTERMLHEGDIAFALGEISVSASPNGEPVAHLAVARDGKRLFVSNYSESELITMERLWFATGATIASLAFLLLAWSAYQRYFVLTVPGVLA